MIKSLAIDVGGTNTDIYYLEEITKPYELIKSYPSKKNISDLITFLAKIIFEYNPLDVLIGLPGPVDNIKESSVFCPPLGYSVDYKAIYDINSKIRISSIVTAAYTTPKLIKL